VAKAGQFAWLVAPGANPPSGAIIATPTDVSARTLFDRHCGTCHAADDLRPTGDISPEEWQRERLTFLESHGEASAEDDARILTYLAGAG
jgi:hypothetical protein